MSDSSHSKQDPSSSPDQPAHQEQSIRELHQEAMKRQSELIGELELQFHHCTAIAESTEKALVYERNILRLMTRYDVGLLDKAGQLELWRLAKAPTRHRGLDPDMKGIFLLGDEDQEGNASPDQANPLGNESSDDSSSTDSPV